MPDRSLHANVIPGLANRVCTLLVEPCSLAVLERRLGFTTERQERKLRQLLQRLRMHGRVRYTRSQKVWSLASMPLAR